MTTLFGGGTSGASEAGLKATERDNLRRERFIREQNRQARRDATRLFRAGDRSLRGGFQSALDVIGAVTPEQLGLFQGGNVAAQNALISGLPQFQAAILGQPTDFSGFQAQQLPADLSFLQGIQVPQIQQPELPTVRSTAPDPFDLNGGGGLPGIFKQGLIGKLF